MPLGAFARDSEDFCDEAVLIEIVAVMSGVPEFLNLQRTLYLSLLRALAARIRGQTERVVRPFILLFEEPEAFLHPEGQIKMLFTRGVLLVEGISDEHLLSAIAQRLP